MDHLLLTLPLPEPTPLIQRIQKIFPNLKITYLRHNVHPTEAFVKQDMEVPPETLRDITILMTMGYVPEPANAPKLRLIHFNVAGTDHVMKKAAFQDPKITITNSTGGPSPAVAEWVVGTMIGHLRQLFVFKEWQKAKTWAKLDMKSPPVNLDGKKLAILGYGSIGRQIARVSQALGMEIIVYTSRPRLTASSRRDTSWYQPGMGDPEGIIPSTWFHGTSKKDLQNFLSQGADVVVLSLPLTEHTKHIIGEQELQTMTSKSPAFLINISRGPIIDQAALLESLKRGASNGGLQGAALDVTDPEPLPAENELWSLPNVFISPHVSSISPGTTGRAFRILEENMTRRLEGRELVNVVKATDRKSSI